MTRLAVLSDIHGNLPALEAVIADMEAFAVDHVVVLGDNVNWGPYSVEVMETILSARWSLIRGNHEFYMLYHNTPFEPQAWKRYGTPRWLNAHLPKRLRDFIAALPDELRLCYPDAPYIRAAHGVPGDHWQAIYPTQTSDAEIEAILAGVVESVVLIGHTHLPFERRAGRWHIINVGAVGVPLDGDPRACYVILDGDADGWRTTFRRVPFDHARLVAGASANGYYDALGITGILMIEEMRIGKPLVHPFAQWRRAHHPDAPDSRALVDAFLALPDLAQEHRLPDYRDDALALRRMRGSYPVIR